MAWVERETLKHYSNPNTNFYQVSGFVARAKRLRLGYYVVAQFSNETSFKIWLQGKPEFLEIPDDQIDKLTKRAMI